MAATTELMAAVLETYLGAVREEHTAWVAMLECPPEVPEFEVLKARHSAALGHKEYMEMSYSRARTAWYEGR